MRRRGGACLVGGAVVFVWLVVATGPAAALPFLQHGVDAARTGATQDPGPANLDIAFNTTATRPEGGLPWGSLPVILGGAVYALQGVNPPDDLDGESVLDVPGPASIHRVDLATAERSDVVRLGEQVVTSGFASDGERLFVVVGNEVRAFDAGTGASVWEQPYVFQTITRTEPFGVICNAPAVADGALYLPCAQVGSPNPGGAQWYATSEPMVVSLDAATGTERWTRTFDAHTVTAPSEDSLLVQAMNYSPGRMALGDGRAYFTLRGFPATTVMIGAAGAREGTGSLVSLGLDDGELVWQRSLEVVGLSTSAPDDLAELIDQPAKRVLGAGSGPALLHTPGSLYVKHVDLHVLDPGTGAEIWRQALLPAGDDDQFTGNAAALFADRLFATAYSTLYAIDIRTHAIVWATPLPSGEDWRQVESMIVAGGRVFAASNTGRVFAFDPDEGSIIEQRELQGADTDFAVGDGVLAALHGDGRVFVFGATPASILPHATLDDAYPSPGQRVALDLSLTRAGLLHATTELRVDWGDGVLTSWSTERRHSHAYATPDERTLTVRFRNPAGQEASETLTVHVGGTPPPQLNLAQKAFDRDNQDLTFGLLGVLIAATGGLWALGKHRRHHSRLDEELARLREIRTRGLEDPPGAARDLERFTSRLESRLGEGSLNDAQFSVLVLQASDLRRTLRKRAVAPLAGRVSPAFRLALDAALEDGRITDAEAKALKAALKGERKLKAEDRREIVEMVDAWTDASDAGAS